MVTFAEWKPYYPLGYHDVELSQFRRWLGDEAIHSIYLPPWTSSTPVQMRRAKSLFPEALDVINYPPEQNPD